ncbi:MAG: RNase adapter RapZ [Oligoflexus sp.]|nr:RNase adapter RapZ [Oligoflexus sp.]
MDVDVVKAELPLLVVVTGLSGAGKSTVINALEDLSFYCMENLPFDLIEAALDHLTKDSGGPRRFAIGVDARDTRFIQNFPTLAAKLRTKFRLDVVFLTCTDEILAERFSTTRRKHPLLDVGGELIAAIRREINLMQPIEALADVSFDTSLWSPHYLARKAEERYSSANLNRQLHVTVVSFGFKYGMLKPADTIFDVRFLRNPHFDPTLKHKTGQDMAVASYVFEDPNSHIFLDKILDLHSFLLPAYHAEGKHYFRIGIGCTGGKHRSVALTERLALELASKNIPNIALSVSHRDIHVGLDG